MLWGRLAATIIGLLCFLPFAGYISIVVCFLAGYLFDYGIARNIKITKKRKRISEDFFRCVFFTLGYISSLDYKLSRQEILAFNEVFSRLELDDTELELAKGYFKTGLHRTSTIEVELHLLSLHIIGDRDLCLLFFDLIATYGHSSHPEFQALLIKIKGLLGIEQDSPNSQAPYQILQLSPPVTYKELKQQYRKLIKQYHPDVLKNKGVPEGFIEFAKNKAKEINNAYDIIKKQENFK